VQYLRDEPEVQRVVAVEGDLGEITSDIAQAEATISRLEAMLASGDRTAVYPALAGRRARVGALEAQVIKLRNDLAEQELRLAGSAGDVASLTAARRQQYAAYAALPDPERAAADHLVQNRAKYDAIEESAAEVDDAIGATQATSVALRKYLVDTPDLPADQRRTFASTLDEAAHEAEAIERELQAVHREIQLGRDIAGIGDTSVVAAAAARARVRAAQDAEHRALAFEQYDRQARLIEAELFGVRTFELGRLEHPHRSRCVHELHGHTETPGRVPIERLAIFQ